jgi:hypothetical protein
MPNIAQYNEMLAGTDFRLVRSGPHRIRVTKGEHLSFYASSPSAAYHRIQRRLEAKASGDVDLPENPLALLFAQQVNVANKQCLLAAIDRVMKDLQSIRAQIEQM